MIEIGFEAAKSDDTPSQYKAPSHDYWVIGFAAFWSAIVCVLGYGHHIDHDAKQMLVGITVNVIQVFFYAAPLSTMWNVIRTRNSSSIHFATMLWNTINSTMWLCYGLALFDYFIFVPNILGTLLGLTQLALRMMFPSKPEEDSEEPKTSRSLVSH